MNITAGERKKYLRQVRRLLVCRAAERKKFMCAFADSIEEYCNAHPDATLAQMQADLGSPNEIANEFLANESAARIKTRIQIARWIKIGIAAALLMLAITLAAAFIDAYKAQRGYGEITISEGPTIYKEDIPDD